MNGVFERSIIVNYERSDQNCTMFPLITLFILFASIATPIVSGAWEVVLERTTRVKVVLSLKIDASASAESLLVTSVRIKPLGRGYGFVKQQKQVHILEILIILESEAHSK